MGEIVRDALKGEVYIRFITEAFRRSDYATFLIKWPAEKFEFFSKDDYCMHGFTEDLYEYMYALREKEYSESKRIFEENCLPFVKALEPYYLDGEKLSPRKFNYNVRTIPETFEFFLRPESLEAWAHDTYPYDLCFVSDNKYWFVSESHGQPFAEMYPNSEKDYQFWRNNGIVFMKAFDYKSDVLDRPQV